MVIFRFRNKKYQIVPNECVVSTPPIRPADDLLRDFEYCLNVRDYQTIKNRITNGLIWGWIKELK